MPILLWLLGIPIPIIILLVLLSHHWWGATCGASAAGATKPGL